MNTIDRQANTVVLHTQTERKRKKVSLPIRFMRVGKGEVEDNAVVIVL